MRHVSEHPLYHLSVLFDTENITKKLLEEQKNQGKMVGYISKHQGIQSFLRIHIRAILV
ncbi:hypothetical protein BDZ91DRAFT_712378, partial [Kalaharituber pfeilii]